MHDIPSIQVLHGLDHLSHYVPCLPLCEPEHPLPVLLSAMRGMLPHEILEVTMVTVISEQVDVVGGAHGLMEFDDVRVVEAAQDEGFLFQVCDLLWCFVVR